MPRKVATPPMSDNDERTDSEWIGIQELADRLGVPYATVKEWNYKKTGPLRHKFGRHIRYRRADVERWIAEQRKSE